MNRNRKIWIAGFMLYLCTASMFAQIRGNEIRVVVSPDHSDWTYRLKEKCTFTIQVYKAQNVLPDVKVDYELGPEWYPTEKKDGVSLKDGKLTVSSSMNTPGFLRCKVKAYVGNKTYDGMATAAYAPESIRAHAVNPSDFDNFWEGTLKEARQVPLSSTMELLPSRCTETVNVYQVSFQNIRQGSRTFGILCMPKASGNYPALLRVPGAGVRPYYGDVETAAKGAITLEIGIHGIPVTMQQSVYDELAYGALYNYQYQNDDNRNYSYYKRVFVGALRAVDFITSLPQYNGKALGVTGSSQGGALSMVTAALDKRVTFYAAIHPAMCDHRAHLQKVAGGWPHYFYYFPTPTPQRIQTADYYDMVNFARRITVPGWYGTLDYENGKYLPSPKDYRNPGYYTDEYGNQTWVGGADWQDLIYQNGFSQEYNLSVSGGSEKGWHAFSGNFLNQDGIIKESGFTRYALRANIGRKMYKWLEMGMNMNFTHTETDFSKTNSNDYGVIRSSLIFPPNYDPTHMDQTTNDELSWLASNPYAYINDTKDHLKAINVFTSSYAEVKLFPFLKFRQNLGISYTNHNRGTYFGQQTQEGSGQNGINGKAGQSDNWYMGITTESLFTFDKTFGVHGINAVVGFTAEKTNWGSKSMSATGFPNDLTQDYDMSLGTKPGKLQSDRGDAALASFLGRINYTLLDKYIFTASYRTDGSSKFTDANKWAGFLSGAFAWRMSEEKFIKDLNIFSNLKFRASYGETGNQGIGSYRTLPMLSVANYPFAGGINSGFAQVDWRGPVADDLRWETTAQYNVGLDMGFLNGRINLTVDYYHKKTRDLLQEVKIPLSTGFANMMVNSGYVTNEGLEISGKFYLLQNTPLKWNIDANISFNKNQIGGLEADQFATRLWYKADEVFLQRNGCPIGTIFGYVEDGFYDNLAEVMADPDPAVRAKGQKMIGEIKYRNFDDNPAITNADRVIIGDTNPDFVYGITNNFSWKNFTLSFFFQGSQGNDIFNGNLMDVKMGNVANIPQAAYDTRWTPETTAIAQWPKAVSSYERNMLISDRYVEDGSYLKLKNLNIGYNWANPFKGIKNLNFYASATNLFTITDYSWFDPEVNAFGSDASRRGVDIYSYPSSRTYSIGMKVTF